SRALTNTLDTSKPCALANARRTSRASRRFACFTAFASLVVMAGGFAVVSVDCCDQAVDVTATHPATTITFNRSIAFMTAPLSRLLGGPRDESENNTKTKIKIGNRRTNARLIWRISPGGKQSMRASFAKCIAPDVRGPLRPVVRYSEAN